MGNKKILSLGNCGGRANIDAITAVFAQGRVDEVDIIASRDSAFFAFAFTGAAHNAIGIN